jgi:hypothetical protein
LVVVDEVKRIEGNKMVEGKYRRSQLYDSASEIRIHVKS